MQIVCFIIFYTVSTDPEYCSDWFRKKARYLVYAVTILYLLVIPIISIAHWLIMAKVATDGENMLRAWILTFPLIGLSNIVMYFAFISDLITLLKAVLDNIDYENMETKVNEICEICETAAIYQIH